VFARVDAGVAVTLLERPVQQRPLPSGPFDLIVVAHVLNEIGDPRRAVPARVELLRDLLPLLAVGGRLLVVEPGTRVHGRALMMVRDALAEQGIRLHAPCTGAPRCPLLQTPGDWCHAEEAWQAPPAFLALEREAGLTKTVLKHSHLLLSREQAQLRGLRLIGGVMQPPRGAALRYACGPAGLVTLDVARSGPAAGREALRGALFADRPALVRAAAVTPSSGPAGPSGRRRGGSPRARGGKRADRPRR
jgi:hypothetical protein